MPKETSTTIRPKDLVRNLVSTPEFGGILARTPDIESESGIGRTALAIGSTAATLVEKYRREQQTTYLDTPHQLLNLVAQTPGAVEAYAVLDAPRGAYDPSEFKRAKLGAIHFNHALRQIIDSSSGLTRSQLQSLVTETTMSMVPNDRAKLFREQLHGSITGMQQEIFTEQALWSIDGVEVADGLSIEDDKRGVDIRFSYGGRDYALDVKSTDENARKAAAQQRPGSESIPFWTGLRGFELGEDFRANKQQEAIIRDRLITLLHEEASARQDVS